jgi:MFS family permease
MVEGGIGIGGALGAWVAGYIFDQYHNYFWAFILAMVLNIVSILLVWIVAPRKAFQRRVVSRDHLQQQI